MKNDKVQSIERPDTNEVVVSQVQIGELIKEDSKVAKAVHKVAVIGVHGMGTHLPMTALKDAEEYVRKSLPRGSKTSSEKRIKSMMSDDGRVLTELEVRYRDKGKEVEVTVFEGYYSPFLKGKATVVDVLTFLLKSGVGSLLPGGKARRIFGKDSKVFDAKFMTSIYLLLTVLSICSLVLLNAAFVEILANVLSKEYQVNGYQTIATWCGLSFLGLGGLFLVASKATSKVGAKLARKGGVTEESKPPLPLWLLGKVSYGLFFVLILALIVAAVLTGVARTGIWDTMVPHPGHGLVLGTALLVGAGSWMVKGFLLDYAGDVVTYVFGYQSSKFYEVREAVVKKVEDIVSSVCNSGRFDAVVVLAHSQGTIVAYDAINRYLLKNGSDGMTVPLKAFVTFGCPLDKIAYIFRSESGVQSPMRNALISSRQPLVDNEELRRQLRWFNVYSKHDIIAGSLESFDPNPPHAESCVVNTVDQFNVAAVSSHTEYARHRGVPLALRKAIAWSIGGPEADED